jgi:hypothetical protein
VEIYLSIVQRKVLTPNDFDSFASVARRLNDFEHLHAEIAEPVRMEVHLRRSR